MHASSTRLTVDPQQTQDCIKYKQSLAADTSIGNIDVGKTIRKRRVEHNDKNEEQTMCVGETYRGSETKG